MGQDLEIVLVIDELRVISFDRFHVKMPSSAGSTWAQCQASCAALAASGLAIARIDSDADNAEVISIRARCKRQVCRAAT